MATLDLFQDFTASQRVALILNSVPLIPLLFNVAFVSFSKGLMSTENKQTSGSNSATGSSGANKNIDSSNDASKDDDPDDEDDDSEPLLGRWFEETLSLFPNDEKKVRFCKVQYCF